MNVSASKTEVQCIGKERQLVKITLGTIELMQSEDFVYLGGVLSHDLSCDKDVIRRIGLAAGIVRSLHKVWEAKDITKSTKVLFYRTLVQSIMYNSQTWTMKEEQKRKLRVFEMTVLRKICGVTWKDRRRNVDILNELSIERDINTVSATDLFLFWTCYPDGQRQIAVYTIIWLHTWTRGKGRPKKRWIDDICEDYMDIGIPI